MSDSISKKTRELGRRQFLATAAAMGVVTAWAGSHPKSASVTWRERRELYPEGVASGDPDSHSVILWTRRPFRSADSAYLNIIVAEDEQLGRVIATARACVSAASDWTCRALIGNLKPSRVYWYRFVDDEGSASRVGRTMTAPADDDGRSVRFAFASCQNINLGALQAYRRMIFEDERAAEEEKIEFVLHLGDFIYEMIWYPEDNLGGFEGRQAREVVRYAQGERIGRFHIPTTLNDYRSVYRAYLQDRDLQDARARWPFVCMWDNEEFSDLGRQSLEIFYGKERPAQTRKVAANQAWFEYQPARVIKSSDPSLDLFDPPAVRDEPILRFDSHGLGDEPNNLAAVGSLTAYRALRWGRNVELIITDQHSYRSEDPTACPEMKSFQSEDFPHLFPQEALEILDAGRDYAGGNSPETITFGRKQIANFRKNGVPQTILGAAQKSWFLQRLKESSATWKIWGNTIGTLDARVDAQNLPGGLTEEPWPGAGNSVFQVGDYATAYSERAEIYAAVRSEKITGFVTVSGNSHSFWAALAAPSLPPQPFEPVGVAFVTGSISSPGPVEYMENNLPHDHPLHFLYLSEGAAAAKSDPVFNILIRHGVRACLEYQLTGDFERARALSNKELSPHLSFLDLNGHGYATVRASSEALECEFVCIPRPMAPTARPDGGPLVYRVLHRTPLWGKGERPRLEQHILEGNPLLSL